MICPNCKQPISDGIAFCTHCGFALNSVPAAAPSPDPEPTIVAPQNSQPNFSGNGIPPIENPYSYYPDSEGFTPPAPKPEKPKSRKKLIIILSVVIAVLVAGAAVATWLLWPSDKASDEVAADSSESSAHSSEKSQLDAPYYEPGLYYSENSLYYYDFETGDSYVISDGIDAETASLYTYEDVYVTGDKDQIMFIEKDADNNGVCGDLIIHSLKDEDADDITVDSDVSYFDVHDEIGWLWYVKDDVLYEYNIKEDKSEEISENGKLKSDDENTTLYPLSYGEKGYMFVDNNGTLYCREFGGETTEIDDNVDFYETFALKDGIVYSKPSNIELNYYDFAIYEASSDSSADESDLWEDEVFTPGACFELYYFDGKESTLLTEHGKYFHINEDGGYWCEYDYETDEKMEASSDAYPYEIEEYASLNAKKKWHLMTDGKSTELELDENAFIDYITEDFDEIWYLKAEDALTLSDDGCDLYKAKIKDGEVTDDEKVDSNVSEVYEFADKVVYYKNNTTDDYSGEDYYIDGEMIAENAYYLDINKDGDIFYTKDIEFDNDYMDNTGKFVVNIDGEETEIAEGTNIDFILLDNGTPVYWLEEDGNLNIYVYAKGKSKEIASIEDYEQGNGTFGFFYKYENGKDCYSILFIDDGDLYTISGNKAKLICENVEYVWCYDLIIDDYESSADSDGEEAADSDAEAEAEPEESEEYAESDGYRAVPQLPSSIYRDTIAPSSL